MRHQQLKNQADKRAESFQSALDRVVGKMAMIQPKTHNITIVCKDLDEITPPKKFVTHCKRNVGFKIWRKLAPIAYGKP